MDRGAWMVTARRWGGVTKNGTRLSDWAQAHTYRQLDFPCASSTTFKALSWDRASSTLYDSEQEGELPWWFSGEGSICQYRRHRFDPWSGKIPHAPELLSQCVATTEPVCLEPALYNKRSHHSPQLEKSLHRKKTQHSHKWIKKFFFKENGDNTIIYIYILKKMTGRAFPDGPVVKIQNFQCRGPGFDPWSGN